MNSEYEFFGFEGDSTMIMESDLDEIICKLTSDANMLANSELSNDVEMIWEKSSTSKAVIEQRQSENKGEKLKKRFEYSGKREPTSDQSHCTGENFYYMQHGKKIASTNEFNDFFKNDSKIECFTIADEPTDVGKDRSIVRETRNTRSKRGRDTFPSTSSHKRQENNKWEDNNPEMENDRNISNEITKKMKPSVFKDKKLLKPCSIRCRKASNVVPALQCQACLCLYHAECVGLPAFYSSPNNSYVCKNCIEDQPNNEGEEPTKNLQIMFNENIVTSANVVNPDHVKQCLVEVGNKCFVYVPKNVQQSKSKNIEFGSDMGLKRVARSKTVVGRNTLKKMRSEKAPEEWFNRASKTDIILEHIFNYLSPIDLQRAAQVCRMWYSVAQTKFLPKKTLITLNKDKNLNRKSKRKILKTYT